MNREKLLLDDTAPFLPHIFKLSLEKYLEYTRRMPWVDVSEDFLSKSILDFYLRERFDFFNAEKCYFIEILLK